MKVTILSSNLLFLHNNLQLVVLALYHYEPGYKDESYSHIFFSSLPPQHYWYWLYVTMSQDMEMKVTLLSSCLLFLHNISSCWYWNYVTMSQDIK